MGTYPQTGRATWWTVPSMAHHTLPPLLPLPLGAAAWALALSPSSCCCSASAAAAAARCCCWPAMRCLMSTACVGVCVVFVWGD